MYDGTSLFQCDQLGLLYLQISENRRDAHSFSNFDNDGSGITSYNQET
jgi:hypothetical protein